MNEEDRARFYKGKIPAKSCNFCLPLPKILLETVNFRVLIDTYPILPGHVMISTKEHYGTAGEIPSHFHEELLQLKDQVGKMVSKNKGSCIFYEHGKAGSCHSSSHGEVHCEHFHLHCLPTSVCIHNEIGKDFLGFSLDLYSDLFPLSESYGSYLYFENGNGNKVCYPANPEKVPSHYLRTLLCKALDCHVLSQWMSYNQVERYLESLSVCESSYQL